VAGIVAPQAIQRLIHPPTVEGGPVIIVAIAGVAVNIVATMVLARASRSSLNIVGAFKQGPTQLYGFIGTVIVGVIIVTTGFVRADAIASLIVALMADAAFELLRDSGWILLGGAPKDLNLDQLHST